MDVQRQRAAGGVLEERPRAQVYGELYRPGILLQCGRVEFSGFTAARGVRAQRCLCMYHRVGVVRAVAEPDRDVSGELGVAAGGGDSAGVVWRGVGGAGEVANQVARKKSESAGARSFV